MARITNLSAPPATAVRNHFSHPYQLHGATHSLYNKLCANLPRQITHPSHIGCTLTLLTLPSYTTATFWCNACRHPGYAWNYHCSRCNYDLHVTCASKPMTARHQAHTCAGDLHLTFNNPYLPPAVGFTCNICRKIGTNQWQYHCYHCSFDAHLDCIAGAPPWVTPHQVVHDYQPLPAAVRSYQYPVNHHFQGYNHPVPPHVQAWAWPPMVSFFTVAALEGLVGGLFQGVGQIVVNFLAGGWAG